MPLFPRQRGKTRRVSLEKARPPEVASGVGGRREKGLVHAWLLGMLFAVLLVLVVIFGQPPLKYSPGQVLTADVHARVPFRFVGQEETEKARKQARLNVPNTYEADNASLKDTEAMLLRTLEELSASKDPEASFAEMKEEFPVPQDERRALITDLKREEDKSMVRLRLRELFDALFAHGIMDDNQKLVERKADAGRLLIGHKSRESETVYSLTEARGCVDAYLSGGLGQGLTGTEEALKAWTKARLKPTVIYDEEATLRDREMAARSVLPQWVSKQAGDLLVARGDRIWKREYEMLETEQETFLAAQSAAERWKRVAGISVLVCTAFLLGGLILSQFHPSVLRSNSRMLVIGALVVSVVLTARLLMHSRVPHSLYLVPVGFASMLPALAYGRRFAFGVTLFTVLMVGLATGAEFRPLLVLLAGGMVASLYTHNIRKRTRLLKIGVLVGLAHVLTIYGVGFCRLQELRTLNEQAVFGMLNGIGVGFLVTGLLPFLEPLLRITTDISLLELGDLNQPVLKSFALRAPGSYNHSLTIGVLAEAAARAVGADDLLTRVGSYFHDIGKINKPQYFVENQSDGYNPHDRLSPQMSSLVISAHTKDGIELGRQLGLPRPILDIIAQHHGTTLVEYFYKRACEQAGDDKNPDEHLFRYGGPPPRSREAAIVMLADSVESAARTLSDPSSSRIGNLVHKIIEAKLAYGQLEECDLTLRELNGIERSLTKGLISIFHGRIKY